MTSSYYHLPLSLIGLTPSGKTFQHFHVPLMHTVSVSAIPQEPRFIFCAKTFVTNEELKEYKSTQ